MKRTVKLVATMLLAVTAIFATSCGGNASKKQSADTTTETTTETAVAPVELRVKDTNKDNWQAVIKAQRAGVDIPLPDGWAVESARPTPGNSTVEVIFNMGGSTTGEQFGQMLMDATKAVAQSGNHKVELTDEGRLAEGVAIGTIGEAVVKAGMTAYNWCFTDTSERKYIHQINYSFSVDKKQAVFTF
jgi:hypothetical protein